MALKSGLFRGDPKLEAAAIFDQAHITPGASGPHVTKIQLALIQLDGARIKADGAYGPATAAAVLAYKQKRNIINRSYESKADNIVGKMTIASLDSEMLAKEAPPSPEACTLDFATPPDAGGKLPRSQKFGLVSGPAAAAPSEADIMAAALLASKASLNDAIGDLLSVSRALAAGQALVPAQDKTFLIATKWLNLTPADKPACVTHLNAAAALMRRNFSLKTSSGTDVVLSHDVGKTFHALSHLNSPDLGLKCGDPFFSPDGPNCRRDVVTHEFFHMIGVTHGGGSLLGPTIRSAITTPAQALDSADNLAQLVAEMRTFKSPNTDACVRAGD